ncbi:MAG TPA: carboxypeptidase-like regulatory domain-containing protein [Tepidisphaeraceae bacterium]|nr:carboxypeptidase-like regulatory domain-containing protein [Tepidisphaeraceae bacterium]
MRAGLLILAIGLAAGCQSAPPPAPGLAELVVHVQAQPKTGAQPPPEKVQVFDTPRTSDYDAFAKVDYSDLGQIVVWLQPLEPSAKAPSPKAITVAIDPVKQSNGLQHVASVGQPIILHNASLAPQTIYSVSDGNDFDFESVPPGRGVKYTARSPGLIEVLTNSPAAGAVQVYVAPSPWVRVVRSGESIRFDNLPPGQYRLVSWHPRLPGAQETITLPPGRVTDASIDVSVNSLPKVSGAR